ncbi:MAG: prepilin-type N-terminal cleavage/methylation domain-containing protein, partial [Planctomycetes bacterium]|nr:prepilin-type N-terminal cleavage/methylation domain-containing protein [Planctomycetota bacterium]
LRIADCGLRIGKFPIRNSQFAIRGFTLLELLVVIAVITILAGLVVPGLVKTKVRAKILTAKSEITRIKSALETYYNNFGDYPPTSLKEISVSTYVNETNAGIESLVACLSTRQKGGPFLLDWPEKRYSNLDNDNTSKNITNWWFGDNELREVTDPWNNPYIYFHARNYDKPDRFSKYQTAQGVKSVTAIPQKSSATATYFAPLTFQIWSIGPELENSNGLGDDVNSWD